MDAFYASVTSFCFVLLGLWWNVVQARREEWMMQPETRASAQGVYLAFLIPGLMSLMAQLAGDAKWLWRLVFILAAVFGALSAYRLQRATTGNHGGWVRKHQWLVMALYALVALVGAQPELVGVTGLKPLQVEGLLLSTLIFLGASLAWEFMTEPGSVSSDPSNPIGLNALQTQVS